MSVAIRGSDPRQCSYRVAAKIGTALVYLGRHRPSSTSCSALSAATEARGSVYVSVGSIPIADLAYRPASRTAGTNARHWALSERPLGRASAAPCLLLGAVGFRRLTLAVRSVWRALCVRRDRRRPG